MKPRLLHFERDVREYRIGIHEIERSVGGEVQRRFRAGEVECHPGQMAAAPLLDDRVIVAAR